MPGAQRPMELTEGRKPESGVLEIPLMAYMRKEEKVRPEAATEGARRCAVARGRYGIVVGAAARGSTESAQ